MAENDTQQGGSEPSGAHNPDPAGSTPASATAPEAGTDATTAPAAAATTEAEILAALKADGVDIGPEETTPVDKPDGDEKPAEGDKPAEDKPADAAKPDEKPPETETELVKRANKTMAAARRAEKNAEEKLAKAQGFETRAKQLDDFVAAAKTDPRQAYLQLGYPDLKSFVEAISNAGSKDPSAPSADDRVAALEKKLAEKEAAEQARAAAEKLQASRTRVTEALGKDERFDLVLSDVGQELLWNEIDIYYKQHGSIPDAAVYAIAHEVEKHLDAQVAKSKKFSRLGGAQKQPSAPATPKPAASTNGKGSVPATTRSAPVAPDNIPVDEHGIPDSRAVLAFHGLL